MGSNIKALLVLILFLATIILISSDEVAPNKGIEENLNKDNGNNNDLTQAAYESKQYLSGYDGGFGGRGGYGGGYGGRGGYGGGWRGSYDDGGGGDGNIPIGCPKPMHN
ncbi:hypothetical protein PIB30_025212 [Stylosanthes scabra]|uniref:Glycine-rich protein n=1 Tax=Stylosanthes scabra TaxID=79078 RepID=A0ABU6RAF1_9FABA|nr:hypothetical protein [Stylosanthes scabra]